MELVPWPASVAPAISAENSEGANEGGFLLLRGTNKRRQAAVCGDTRKRLGADSERIGGEVETEEVFNGCEVGEEITAVSIYVVAH